jgi:hypothetical protein
VLGTVLCRRCYLPYQFKSGLSAKVVVLEELRNLAAAVAFCSSQDNELLRNVAAVAAFLAILLVIISSLHAFVFAIVHQPAKWLRQCWCPLASSSAVFSDLPANLAAATASSWDSVMANLVLGCFSLFLVLLQMVHDRYLLLHLSSSSSFVECTIPWLANNSCL